MMVKILGLEAEGGYEGRGKKISLWGDMEGEKFFWGSLEGGDGGGQKGFSLRGEKKNFPYRVIRGGRKNFFPCRGI